MEARARMQGAEGAAREFSVFLIKRLDTLALARTMKEIGWAPVDGWPYGQEVGYPRALYLFCKR